MFKFVYWTKWPNIDQLCSQSMWTSGKFSLVGEIVRVRGFIHLDDHHMWVWLSLPYFETSTNRRNSALLFPGDAVQQNKTPNSNHGIYSQITKNIRQHWRICRTFLNRFMSVLRFTPVFKNWTRKICMGGPLGKKPLLSRRITVACSKFPKDHLDELEYCYEYYKGSYEHRTHIPAKKHGGGSIMVLS